MDFSVIELSSSGKSDRDSASQNLQKAIDDLNEVQGILKQLQGIGTEFLIASIEELKGDVKNCKSNLYRL